MTSPETSTPAGAHEHATSRPQPQRAAWWALPLALFAGVITPTQSRINGQLAAELGDPFVTALISFGVGFVVVTVLVALNPQARRATAQLWHSVRSGTFPWYWTLGGLGGAFFVLAQSLTVTLVGVALFIVSIVAGQAVTGLVIDRFGIGPGGPRPLTGNRVLGAALMVIAVVLAMSAGVHITGSLWLLVLPLVAGVTISLQQALNGRVTAQSGHFLTATWVNFVLGTAVLALAALVHGVAVGWPPHPLPSQPVLYLGGLLGVVYIAVGAHLARPLGVLILSMALVAGQVTGSVLIDVVAPVGDEHLRASTVAGALLTLVAAAITAGFLRPPRRTPRA